MSAPPTDSIRAQVAKRLDAHTASGAQASLTGIVDEDALKDERYREVLEAVEDRLSQARFTLISMLVSGIYFGLLVGLWLVDLSTWRSIAQWGVPVVLVMTYGIYSTHHTASQIRRLSEARMLLLLLAEDSSGEEIPP